MMNTIYSLIYKQDQNETFPLPDPNPLADEGCLVESVLLDITYVNLVKSVVCIIDLRTSIYFSDTNTGVLLLRGVEKVSISHFSTNENYDPYIWIFGDVLTSKSNNLTDVELVQTGSEVKFRCTTVEFYAGNVRDIPDAPVNISTEGLQSYQDGNPDVMSLMEVKYKSTI